MKTGFLQRTEKTAPGYEARTRPASGIPLREGSAILVVLGIVFIALLVVGMASSATVAFARRARLAVATERAFFAAEGGAERAASAIADAFVAGTDIPVSVSGEIGGCAFSAQIVVDRAGEGESDIVGSIRINPGNSDENFFFTELPDGTQITRNDLHSGYAGYEGAATHVHARPMGGGSQSGLTVDGVPYTLENNQAHDITSESMTVRLWNDHVNPQGKALGKWWIDIDAEEAQLSSNEPGSVGSETRFTIFSEATVGDVQRRVTITGLHRTSWARYALWYDRENPSGLWMVGGESFEGPVYTNQPLRFHSYKVGTYGQTHFYDRAYSTASSIQRQYSYVNPIFEQGLTLNAPEQSMASIDFDELESGADLVLQGETEIVLDGASMYVTNARQGWYEEERPVPSEGSVYVQTARTGNRWTRSGDLTVAAPDGFEGQVTLVAERYVNIVDHVRYATDPRVDSESEDALGLIAGTSVVVRREAPDDLEIFAHIIARDAGFGVEDYNDWWLGDRGTLLVYGGIVNAVRQAVGTTSGTGYNKNYVYDPRFQETPPPSYPVIDHEFQWERWDDR